MRFGVGVARKAVAVMTAAKLFPITVNGLCRMEYGWGAAARWLAWTQ